MDNIKVIVVGPPSAGKTTAVQTICQTAQAEGAIDSGFYEAETILLGNKVKLCAVPDLSQLANGLDEFVQDATGLILLLDNTRPEPFVDLWDYVDAFKVLISETELAVGITKMDIKNKPTIADYHIQLQTSGLKPPIFSVDARNQQDISLLVQALLLSIEPNLGF